MSEHCCSCIILENEEFILKLGADAVAKSLVCKKTGVECLMPGEETALFSLTEERPFNNEIKLAHPNKRTTFQANRVRREGDKLIVGFELVTFEAVIGIKIAPKYIAFELIDFLIKPEDFGGLAMTPPPVYEFRMIQLAVKNRRNFGEWLNVAWDEEAAVNVLSTSPWPRIDAEKRNGYRIMYAESLRDVKLKGVGAAIIVTPVADLLDAIETLEIDYDLPRGVASRRGEKINASAYWNSNITPETVDEHIAYAKQGGFRMMLLYYPSMVKEDGAYWYNGNYDFRPEYPNGTADLKAMLSKIKAAGITPGIHFLQTHIGTRSRYVTPVADHRLNLTRYFTLSKPLGTDDDTIWVEQNPEGAVMDERCRVLKFGGELIHYEAYTTEYPYCFTGCKRGHFGTNVITHELGQIGGILDISEFGAGSVYLDQCSSLQDEIAVKIANLYDCGFEFIYFDGSEGTNPPFEIYVPLAQYRVWKSLEKKPLYCEGAAKAHFSWHFLSGGNAFDVFPTNIFKKMIARFPAEEAPRMACDFTRLNFGWWAFYQDTMPDGYEYGTSLAAAWDCPVTMMARPEIFKSNPRTADTLEVLRRWEDVRKSGWLTQEKKEQLRNTAQEHTLLINEQGAYELAAYDKIEKAAGGDEALSAFVFERNGRSYVTFWHTKGEGKLSLALNAADVCCEKALGGEKLCVEAKDGGIILPVAGKAYISAAMPKEALIAAFESASWAE
ncbi:MAG: hypothetical protein E7463_08060 [Ruminococcaceae bacterium]|nr:hypothetical protein [Oscillospiraceae bacterium]